MMKGKTRRGIQWCHFALVILCSMLFYPSQLIAQDTICTYDWDQNVDCPARLPCIEQANFADTTIQIASNITRIGTEGLRICLSDTTAIGPADIVYVVDMSGSMHPYQHFFDPHHTKTTSTPAGDPFYTRPEAIQSGFNYQINNYPNSRVGYIGFAKCVLKSGISCDRYTQLYDYYTEDGNQMGLNTTPSETNVGLAGEHYMTLDYVSNQSQQTSMENLVNILEHDVHLYNIGGTNYSAALSEAITLFDAPGGLDNKAIIFISDGFPIGDSNWSNYISQLNSRNITVYGIYLNTGESGSTALQQIVTSTGGSMYVIDYNEPERMREVVEEILVTINNVYSFESLNVSGNGQVANGINAQKDADAGTWTFDLDGIIPLYPGENTISINSDFSSAAGGTTISFDFTLDVSGPSTTDNDCQTCRQATQIEILNSSNQPLDSLTWNENSFVVRVTYYGGDALNAIDVEVGTTEKEDYEIIRLTNPSTGANGELIFTRSVPFEVLQPNINPGLNNGTAESQYSDTVNISFHHPVDNRDSATVSIPVIAPPDGIGIYDGANNPASVYKFPIAPVSYTVTAGDSLDLYAKIFSNTSWLESYESDPLLSQLIKWQIADTSGSYNKNLGEILSVTGNQTTFIPKKASSFVDITAKMFNGIDTIQTTSRFYIEPGAPALLSIESSPDSSYSPNSLPVPPLSSVTIGSNVTTAPPVYAVLRDKYENWIGPDTNVTWGSINPAIASVHAGSTKNVGVITRVASADSTWITGSSPGGLADTIKVIIQAYNYTEITITTGAIADSLPALTIKSDDDTTVLMAYGKRSDNQQWEQLPSTNWSIDNAIVSPSSIQGSSSWPFVASATGTATITASAIGDDGSTITDVLILRINHGAPVDMVLVGSEGGVTSLPGDITILAGQEQFIAARLKNNVDEWIPITHGDSLSTRIQWSLTGTADSETAASLSNANTSYIGDTASFLSTVAHNTYTVTVEYSYQNLTIPKTVIFTVNPNAAAGIYIEANPEWQESPNTPRPLESITISSEESTARAYAILRDAYGNYVKHSDSTIWNSLDSSVATAASGTQAIFGQGLFTRVAASGSTQIIATQNNLSDTTVITILEYYYNRLQIFVRTGSATKDLDSLTMNTNEDTLFYVKGRRSNNAFLWDTLTNEPTLEWQISPSLSGVITGASGSGTFPLSPSDTAHGWVRATLGNDQRTRPDTVLVTFTPGPATELKTTVITPADQRIAGDTITVQLQTFNKDGLMIGDSCYSAVFGDTLTGGNDAYPPEIIVPDPDAVNGKKAVSLNEAVELCFDDGSVNIQVVLTHAPVSKKPHVLTTTLDSRAELTDSSGPIGLLPGIVDSISIRQIVGYDTTDISSLVLQYPSGIALLVTEGYDRFGNIRGLEYANWEAQSPLPAYTQNNSRRLFYEVGDIDSDVSGFLIVNAVNNNSIMDTVDVSLIGPLINMEKAMYRDTSGDGYIDMVEITFSEPFTFDSADLHDIVVNIDLGSTSSFQNAGIIGANGTLTDSVFYLSVNQLSTYPSGDKRPPQTQAEMSIQMSDIEGVNDISNRPVSDGAGPVIWLVQKRMGDANDGQYDRIIITFSEPIRNETNTSIYNTTEPGSFLTVWDRIDDQYTEVDGILDNIDFLQLIEEDQFIDSLHKDVSKIEFLMSNDADLLSRYYVNIDAAGENIFDDSDFRNATVATNQKVKVALIYYETILTSYPNPAQPGFTRVPAGQVIAGHQPNARNWVKTDNFGTIINFEMSLNCTGITKAYLKIYDIAGNLVALAENENLLAQIQDAVPTLQIEELETYPVDIYWNGSNQAGQAVAPGIYRIIVYIDFEDNAQCPDLKKVVTIGISK